MTPRANMTLAFYTWSEFEKNCGYSRLYGGVNFPDSISNIKQMAIQMGRRAIDFIRYHVNLSNIHTILVSNHHCNFSLIT